jgi:hypothetical protein
MMGERKRRIRGNGMRRFAFFATILAAFALTPADAQTARKPGASAPADLSSQARPPSRLRVYPGRLLYRDCTFRLAQEWRPSGPVVVPRQRCWWVRG